MNLKILAPSVTAVVVALIGAWQVARSAAASKTLSREDVKQIVRTESPYVQDRALLLATMTRHEKLLLKIDEEVIALRLDRAKDRVILEQLLRRSR